MTQVPFVGNTYKVISGPYNGFEGKCVSCDLESGLPIILRDEEWNTRAVKINEVELVGYNNPDITRTQQN